MTKLEELESEIKALKSVKHTPALVGSYEVIDEILQALLIEYNKLRGTL